MKKKQYVVFGAGKFGKSIAVTLQALDCDVIVVDKDPEVIQEIADEVSYAVCMDVGDPETFRELELQGLDAAVISITDSLEASIVTTMMCKEAGIRRIIAKTKSAMHEKILKSVGATEVIYPEDEMGRRLAKHLVADNFSDWIDLSPEFSIVEMDIPGAWIGRSLIQLKVREQYGINVIGIKQNDQMTINLDPLAPLKEKTVLVVVGANKDLEALQN